jgi:hypothetical protein
MGASSLRGLFVNNGPYGLDYMPAGNTRKKSGERKMKKILKLFSIIALVAVIGFSMAACGDGGGGGTSITITGLGSHNGKSVNIYISSGQPHDSGNTVASATGATITGGSVTFQLSETVSGQYFIYFRMDGSDYVYGVGDGKYNFTSSHHTIAFSTFDA